MIHPTPLLLWGTDAFSKIEIEPDRDITMDRWRGIVQAIKIINKVALQRPRSTGVRVRSITTLSDSMPSYKQPRTLDPLYCEAPENDSELTGQKARPPFQGNLTHSPLSSLARRPSFDEDPNRERHTPGGGMNGKNLKMAVIFVGLTTHCRPNTRVWNSTQEPSLPTDTAANGALLASLICEDFPLRDDDDLCVFGERESVTHVLQDCPDLRLTTGATGEVRRRVQ